MGLGLTLTRMMENAGADLAWLASAPLGGEVSGRRITVLARPGAKGGGELVAARRLIGWGADVAVRLASDPADLAAVLPSESAPAGSGSLSCSSMRSSAAASSAGRAATRLRSSLRRPIPLSCLLMYRRASSSNAGSLESRRFGPRPRSRWRCSKEALRQERLGRSSAICTWPRSRSPQRSTTASRLDTGRLSRALPSSSSSKDALTFGAAVTRLT